MLVGLYAGETLQHLVTFDRETISGAVEIGKHRAPDGMRVEDCSRGSFSDDANVQVAFIRGARVVPANDPRILIDSQYLLVAKCTFINAAWGDRQTQRISCHHGAEVATGSQCPPAKV